MEAFMTSLLLYLHLIDVTWATFTNSLIDPSSLSSLIPSVGRFDHYELAGLHEGDIVQNPNLIQNQFEGDLLEKHAVLGTDNLWPGGVVYYEFSPEYSFFPVEKLLIKSVMKDIEKHSCVTFQERNGEYDYIKIIYDTYRCYSSVGRIGGEQPLSLGLLCVVWWDKGNIYHELFHALGFHHEHTRPDRDDYITVHWDNIKSQMKKNFVKRRPYKSNTLDLPYDIGSVMHYSPHAFSKLFLLFPTLESKEKGIFFLRARYPSEMDYEKLNRLYNCQNFIRRKSRRRSSRLLYPSRGIGSRRKSPPTKHQGGKSIGSKGRSRGAEGRSIGAEDKSFIQRILGSIFPEAVTSKSRIYNYSGSQTTRRKAKNSWYNYLFN